MVRLGAMTVPINPIVARCLVLLEAEKGPERH